MSYATVDFHSDLTDTAGAALSTDGVYRYQLWRKWADGPWMTFIMLNPSTADHSKDDPTIRRCIGFARRENCGGIMVVNLYAFRATKPDALLTADDPRGPLNMHFITEALALSGGPNVAAWGAWWKSQSRRVKGPGFPRIAVESLARDAKVELVSLGVTALGAPRHPLYVKADTPLVPWPA